jgi:hypothetical protein
VELEFDDFLYGGVSLIFFEVVSALGRDTRHHHDAHNIVSSFFDVSLIVLFSADENTFGKSMISNNKN